MAYLVQNLNEQMSLKVSVLLESFKNQTQVCVWATFGACLQNPGKNRRSYWVNETERSGESLMLQHS